ncbi:unnamed protein product [Sphenostylis stenocarpa]|uniref:Uncharacterized protein n=1 Tax=Sphenostylis stenocarpa TaxID=92480 RepID=A0AA86SC01_9FABA|nr:unnamed protein product [Sphenostylis stenocarpa]
MSWEGAAKWVVGINGKKDDYYSRPSTLNCGVPMGSGALVLGMIAPAKCCAINGYMDSTDTRLTCDA